MHACVCACAYMYACTYVGCNVPMVAEFIPPRCQAYIGPTSLGPYVALMLTSPGTSVVLMLTGPGRHVPLMLTSAEPHVILAWQAIRHGSALPAKGARPWQWDKWWIGTLEIGPRF